MHLSQAPQSVFDLIAREDGVEDLKCLGPAQRRVLFLKLGAVSAVLGAGYGARGRVVAATARANNVSTSTVNLWLSSYHSGGFRALIDGRTGASARATLPALTKSWIADEILRVQRGDGIREVRRLALSQWRSWRKTGDPRFAIPGYLTPPADCGKGYPAGWSYENFRRCKPHAYQEALARQGRVAADRLLPSILNTRVGTRYLEWIFFDDQVYDHMVREPSYDRAMRPVGFNALDRLTAYSFSPHIRLRWWDENSETHRTLTQREFVWYVFNLLVREGYRTDDAGTTLVFEHGTANAWSNLKLATSGGHHSFSDALSALTGGSVMVERSGLYNKPAFKELLYGPQSSGNPRFKAPIESFFHLVRTYHLALPGQTGRNADISPEELPGLMAYEKSTLALAAKNLPPALRDAVASSIYSFREFGSLALHIYDALNSRGDHMLEGWDACGFTDIRWRWAEDPPEMWRSRALLASLPQHLRETAIAQQGADPSLTRVVRLSPCEARAMQAGDPHISRLSRSDAWALMPLEWAQPMKVRDKREIWITDPLCGHGQGNELIYLTEVTNLAGRTEYLQPGDQVLALVDPFDTDTLLVADQSGTPIGSVIRSIRDTRSRETFELMMRERGRMAGALDSKVRAALSPVAAERAAVRDANKSLFSRLNDDQDSSPSSPPVPSPRRRPSADADPFATSVSDLAPATLSDDTDPFV